MYNTLITCYYTHEVACCDSLHYQYSLDNDPNRNHQRYPAGCNSHNGSCIGFQLEWCLCVSAGHVLGSIVFISRHYSFHTCTEWYDGSATELAWFQQKTTAETFNTSFVMLINRWQVIQHSDENGFELQSLLRKCEILKNVVYVMFFVSHVRAA